MLYINHVKSVVAKCLFLDFLFQKREYIWWLMRSTVYSCVLRPFASKIFQRLDCLITLGYFWGSNPVQVCNVATLMLLLCKLTKFWKKHICRYVDWRKKWLNGMEKLKWLNGKTKMPVVVHICNFQNMYEI